ncbi:MAG: thiolase family protein [Pseudomonadota bacterium]
MKQAVIVGAKRTPMASFQGRLSAMPAPELGGVAVRAAIDAAGVQRDSVDEVIMGCVLPAGQGQAPARQAGFLAGLPESVPATTVNKMCGSGMRTVLSAVDQIALGRTRVVVAGGMESMSNAPYMLPKMRDGARIGHARVVDHMFLDGLEDAYDKGQLMGRFAEQCAREFQFTREAQDRYAIASLNRALAAQKTGSFDAEIAPVVVKGRGGADTVDTDEQPGRAKPEKIPHLKPAFYDDGTVTAANSSSISDGAAAVVVADHDHALEQGFPIRARVVATSTHGQAPATFPTAPIPAARTLLDQIGWDVSDVDLWEVNEAFAVVPMAFMRELQIDHDRLNVNGGACALGHPIGASGARILVTLLHALEDRGLKRGIAAICIGGGEGMAMAIERD